MNEHEALADRAATSARSVALVGSLDSGKTTLAHMMLTAAVARGRTCALIDADVGERAVGPLTCVGMKMIREAGDLAPDRLAQADAIHFVGSASPQGHLLPIVAGTGRLCDQARELGAEFVVLDTSGLVSGVEAQLLKYHEFELLQPDLVVGLQRGEELLPLLGIVQRFFAAEVITLPIAPEVVATTVDERAAERERALSDYFSATLQRWRVKATVFMPALPPMFDLSGLDRLLVGLSDGKGAYLGLGYLEWARDEGVLRLVSPVADAPKALRLGSVRLDEGFSARRVDLQGLLGTD